MGLFGPNEEKIYYQLLEIAENAAGDTRATPDTVAYLVQNTVPKKLKNIGKRYHNRYLTYVSPTFELIFNKSDPRHSLRFSYCLFVAISHAYESVTPELLRVRDALVDKIVVCEKVQGEMWQ